MIRAITQSTRPETLRDRLGARVGPLPAPARRVLGTSLLEGLATPHGVDRYLEALHPLWSLEGGLALVTEVRPETADTITITLRPDHAWTGFVAGQHVRLGIEIDGSVRTRTYSVSCSAHRDDDHVTITVKRKEGGQVSGHLTTALAPGDVVHCSPATGEVVLPEPRPGRLLLISGGSGITPVASMLRTLADEDHRGRVTFLHYARTPDDVPFAEDLAAIAEGLADVEVVVVPTSPASTSRLTGHLGPDHLEAVVPDHLDTHTVACGPTALIDTLEAHYEQAGAEHRLHVERFTPPALRATTGPGDGVVRFQASDVEVADDGRTLLEQAEAAGLAPAYGCRMGICQTCTSRKPAGAVTNLRTGRTSSDPDENAQICITVPAGDVVLDL